MKWITVNYPSASVQKYQLVDDNITKVILKYNQQQQTARISCEEKQRLFFIEKAGGLWNNKFVFKNEYGVELGRFTFDKSYSHTGNIEIEGRKYHYAIRNKELVIYDRNISSPIVICDLASSFDSPSISLTNNKDGEHEHDACLLLGLCWYFFFSGRKENAMELTESLSVI